MRLTLYSKPGCHLCEDLRALLDEVQPEFGFALDEINIQEDESLFARYRYDIPVLLVDGREIARGRVDEGTLVDKLRASLT